jgi:hypothetical protein
MAAILAILGHLLSVLLEALGIIQAIKGVVDTLTPTPDNVAIESTPLEIQTGVGQALLTLADVRDDIAKVRLDTSSPRSGTIQDVLDGLTAVFAEFDNITVVTLPTTPPPGYGGADAPTVWAYVIPVGQMCALD